MSLKEIVSSLVLVTSSMWAGDTATMTITERSGSAQANRPFSISRVFKQGEITGCAQPILDGVEIEQWQCDKRATWSDGTLKHAIVSFVSTLQPNQQLSVAFRDTPNSCHLGDLDTCQQAALDGTKALAFRDGDWDAAIEVANKDSSSFALSAKTMLADGNYRYWLRGPVVTQFIVEDRTPNRSYDFGWDPAPKGLHPMFILTFYTGVSSVKAEAIVENNWSTDLADQSYSLTVKKGGGSTVYSRPLFTHYATARWRRVFWDGEAPHDVRYDWNLPYLISTTAIPNYDTSIQVTKTHVDALRAKFLASDRGEDFGSVALWNKSFPTPGGRPDIGWLASWYVQYLFNSDERLEPVMAGLAAVAGHAPLHYRDGLTDPDKKWCPSTCTGERKGVPAFGRPVSVETRPQVYLQRNYWQWNGTPPSDRINPLGPTSVADWRVDIAHHPSIAYLPYMLTGDFYLYEEMLFWVSHAMGSAFWRGGEWGLMTPTSQMEPRGQAWAIRTLTQAAFFAIDDSPEKEYFAKHIEWQAEYMEGYYAITDGNYPPSNASCPGYTATSEPSNVALRNRWCHGRLSVGFRTNPLAFPGYPTAVADNCSYYHFAAYRCDQSDSRFGLWMAAYQYISLGMAIDQGASAFSRVHQHLANFWIDGILDPDSLPFLIAGGGFYGSWFPATSTADKQFFRTWQDWKQTMFTDDKTALTAQMDANAVTLKVGDPKVIGFGRLVWTRTVAKGDITRIQQEGKVVTITFSRPHGLQVGDPVYGAGAPISQFNTIFTVSEIPNDTQIRFQTSAPDNTTVHQFPSFNLKTVTAGIPVKVGKEIVNVCGIESDGTLQVGGSTLNSTCGPAIGGRGFSNGVPRQAWPVGTQVSRDYTTWNTTVTDAVHGYPWVARAAHSFATRYTSTLGRKGSDAWAWIEENLNDKFGQTFRAAGNPAWAILPRPQAEAKVEMQQQKKKSK